MPYFNKYEDFERFFDESDGTMDYSYMSKDETGLNVDLYVDVCGSYKYYMHPLWVYFCDGYEHDGPLVPITISEDPTIEICGYNINLTQEDFNAILDYIKKYSCELVELGNKKITDIEFLGKQN